MQNNDSGKQFLVSHAKIFQKGWAVSKENDPPLKNIFIYLPFTHLALSQFYRAMEVDC